MATETATATTQSRQSIVYSVTRSLVTPYWPYTAYVLAYATFAFALASANGVADWATHAALLVAIYLGLEGLHALDLADDGVAVNIDNRIAYVVGSIEVLVGVAIGAYLAATATLLLLPLALVAAFLGLAYNLEWFDGLLHDRDKITGLANFGITWGAIPFLAGYLAVTQELSLGVGLVALGVALDAVRVNYLEGHGRLGRYEVMGIEHDRGHKSTGDEARAACNKANIINLGAWLSIAAGVVALFAL